MNWEFGAERLFLVRRFGFCGVARCVFKCRAQGKNPPYAEDFEYDDEDHRRGFGGMSRKNEECEMRNDELGVWSGALAFFGSFGLIVQSYIQLAISN